MKRLPSPGRLLVLLALMAPLAMPARLHALSNEIYIGDAFAGESDSAIRFPIERRNPEGTVSIRLIAAGGTMGAGEVDHVYTLVDFAVGETAKELVVGMRGNSVVDGAPRTFSVRYYRWENGSFPYVFRNTGTAWIADDDSAETTLSLIAVGAQEYEGGAWFHLIRQGPDSGTVSGTFGTRDGLARAGSDYTPASAAIELAAGTRFFHVAVPVLDDMRHEFEVEDLHADVSGIAGATPAALTATTTIRDDDSAPDFFFSLPAQVAESAGSVPLAITKQGDTDVTATLRLTTWSAGQSAVAGEDFEFDPEAECHFAPEETEKIIDIPILQDDLDEADEYLGLYADDLRFPDGSSAYPGSFANASTYIIDDDEMPTLSISDVMVEEGRNPNFPLLLTAPTGRELSIEFELIPATATQPADYRYLDYPGTVYPGEAVGSITAAYVVPDGISEPDETFSVRITRAEGVILGNTTATATIVDRDASPTLTILPALTTTEADGAATPTLLLTRESGWPIDVHFTATSDNADAELITTGGTITIPPGNRTWPLPVVFRNDDYYEREDRILVTLTGADRAFLGSATTSLLTVTNDDPRPFLEAEDLEISEGIGTATLSLRVVGRHADGYYGLDISGLGGSADWRDADFPRGTPGFFSDTGLLSLEFPVTDDSLDEEDEDYALEIRLYEYEDDLPRSSVTATIRILDNDGPPTISLRGDGGIEGGEAYFVAELSGESAREVSVDLVPMAGTARLGDDFSLTTQTLTFSPGNTSAWAPVSLPENAAFELTETFAARLENPRNATVAVGRWDLLIADNDPMPSVSVSASAEVESHPDGLAIPVQLTGATEVAAEMRWRLEAGSALPGADYPDTSGTLTIAPGTTGGSVVVRLVDDRVPEPDEAFEVILFDVRNATLADDRATGTILNDDEQDQWLIR